MNSDPSKSAPPTRRKRRRRRQDTPVPKDLSPVRPGMRGGLLRPLSVADLEHIHDAVLTLLDATGLSEAPQEVIDTVCAGGGRIGADGRLTFPPALVEKALGEFQRGFTLHGQSRGHGMQLSGTRVHMGSGGAAPNIVDLDTGRYRHSTLRDLYDAARLVDTLDNVHFFSRSLVAGDMPDEHALDINTAWACLAGTAKHVCVSASRAEHVDDIAKMCYLVAGSRDAFVERPFLSLNVNHVTPPLRVAAEAFAVLKQAALLGIPAHANVFAQVGASTPVGLAGAVAQSVAEALAGGIYAWLINPQAKVVFGPKPMITDLRTGGMSGGGGEQAMVMAAATQMMHFYDLPNVSIAGATDSKIADAQGGYEKALSVTLAAHAGSHLITQACGMQASLLGCALESYVIDNDMLGDILSSLRPPAVDDAALAVESIDRVVRSRGHFLGEPETRAQMRSEFRYPEIADRRPPVEWEADGGRDIRHVARKRTREILGSHQPHHLDRHTVSRITETFDIHLRRTVQVGAVSVASDQECDRS